MSYIEVRVLTAEAVRAVCIEHNWYTCGTNEEYSNLLHSVQNHWKVSFTKNATADDLGDWAEDIKAHSDTDYEVTEIMAELAKASRSVFWGED